MALKAETKHEYSSKVTKVDIGVLEKKESLLLHPKFFPSKVGGKPAWLDLNYLCNPKELLCPKCEDPLIFLIQVYAPYEDLDTCFHRTIFVFICRNGSCCSNNSADNFVVLRCQLPRKNIFYSFEPCKENEEFEMDKWPKLCEVCGIKGPSHCSKCKKTFYCSRKHQVLDWQKGHKAVCSETQDTSLNNFIVTEAGKLLLFDEWELIVDEEDDDEQSQDVNITLEIDKMKKMIEERKIGTLNDVNEKELEQYATKIPKDKIFNKFSKRVSRHPDQVLRYDRDGAPLWITNTNNISLQVPNCEYCNGERQFEFQIMPQLLNFINVGVDVNSIDWGVLAVYTCKASCNSGPAYKKEYLIKQDLCT